MSKINKLGFPRGFLTTRPDVEPFVDVLKQALTALQVSWRDDCCGTEFCRLTPICGVEQGSGSLLFYGAGTPDNVVNAPQANPADAYYIDTDTGSIYRWGNPNWSIIFNGEILDASIISFSNVQEFADNAAAITGGLSVGQIYRTSDTLKIVH